MDSIYSFKLPLFYLFNKDEPFQPFVLIKGKLHLIPIFSNKDAPLEFIEKNSVKGMIVGGLFEVRDAKQFFLAMAKRPDTEESRLRAWCDPQKVDILTPHIFEFSSLFNAFQTPSEISGN